VMFDWYFHMLRVMRWIDTLRQPKANPWRAVFLRYAVQGDVVHDE
jgi:hypothetical protein